VDPEGRFGANLLLQSAATYLAVSLVCRMIAATDLKLDPENKTGVSSWILLAENYRQDYDRLIKGFHPGRTGLNRPTLS